MQLILTADFYSYGIKQTFLKGLLLRFIRKDLLFVDNHENSRISSIQKHDLNQWADLLFDMDKFRRFYREYHKLLNFIWLVCKLDKLVWDKFCWIYLSNKLVIKSYGGMKKCSVIQFIVKIEQCNWTSI